MAPHHFLDKFRRHRLVTGLGGEGFQDPAFVVDGAPQINLFAVDPLS